MKKTILACLALMAISICLFVSCNAEQVVPKNRTDVAYIKFGEEASRGSSFSASVTPKPYKDLYWFYTATKFTNDGLTGATGTGELAAVRTTDSGDSSAPATGIVFTGDECLGPFSQGTWTFTLKAYSTEAYVTTTPNDTSNYDETTILFKDGTKKTVWLKKDGLVYETESPIKVTLYAGQTKTINPLTTTVKAVGTTGIVTFEDAWFVYNDKNSSLAPTITMTATSTDGKNKYVFTSDTNATVETGTTKYILSLAKDESKTTSNAGKITYSIKFQNTTNSLAVGTYACTISATDRTGKNVPLYDSQDNEIPITSLTFYFVVYGGATTTIKGTLNENPYSFIKFDVEETTEMQVNYNTLTDKNGVQVNDNVKLNLNGVANLKTDTEGDNVSYKVTVSESKNYKEGDEAFVVTGNKGTESGVDKVFKVEMEKVVNGTTTEKITDFKDSSNANKAITISFNVGTSYTSGNVTVVYKGSKEQPSSVEYDSNNGILTITITHLSEFVVIDTTKLPVKIEKTGSVPQYFDNLKNAFANAAEGDTITLLNNATLGGVIETTKNVTLDLNGKTVSKNDDEYILVKTGTTLTVNNPASGQANFIIGIAGTTTNNSTPYTAAQAQITTSNDTTCYEKLSGTEGAIAKANANDTVTLVQDVTLDADITVDKALTLNMNNCVVTHGGKTITVSGDSGLVITGSNKSQTAFINGIRVSSSTATGIDGTYYNTLAAAVNNAPEGSTITLFADVTLTGENSLIPVEKSITINLNEKTISSEWRVFEVKKGTLTITNGEIKAEISKDIGKSVILVSAASGDAGLVLKKDATIKAPNSYGVTSFGTTTNKAVLDIYGTIESANPCLAGNGGTSQTVDLTINVYEGAVLSQDSSSKSWKGLDDTTPTENNDPVAIYQPNAGTLNIYGGTITSVNGSAVEIRAGKANIYGGTLITNAEKYEAYNGNGPSVKGAAVAVSQHTTKKSIEVNISGGTFTAEKGKQLVVVDTLNDSTVDNKKLVKVIVLPGVSMDADKIVGTKTGGSTGVDGTYYIDGESAIANGVGASAKIGTTFYHTLQDAIDAIDAAKSDETITLVDNVNADWLYIVNGLTIDLNNKTLTITNDGSIEIGDYGYDNAAVKITNGNLVYNKVTDTIFPHYGIFVYKGSLTLDKVTMTGGEGATGGIYVNDENGASLTVNDSTLTLLYGVGIKFGYGTPSTTVTGSVNIINSTIEGKTYALELQKGTSAVLTNSELKGGTSDIALFGGSKVSGTLKEGSSVTIDETSEGSVELKEGDTVYVAGLKSFDNVVRSLEGENVTIKLLQNLEITERQQRTYGKSFTLDLNEKTLSLSNELNFGYDSGYSKVSVSQTIKNGKVSVKNGGYIRFEMSSAGTFENVEFSSSDGKFNKAFETYALNNTGVNTYTFTSCIFTDTSLVFDGGSDNINKNKYDVKFTNCTFTSSLGFKEEAVSTDYAYGSFVFDKCCFTNEGITFASRDIADAPYDIDIKNCTFNATSMSSDGYFVGTAWTGFVYGTMDISGTTFTATDNGNKQSSEACIEIENSLPSCGELLKITLSGNTFTTTSMDPFGVRRFYTNLGYKLTATVTLDTEKPNTFTKGGKTIRPTFGETEITWSE